MLLIVRLLLVAHQRTEHGIVFHVVPIDDQTLRVHAGRLAEKSLGELTGHRGAVDGLAAVALGDRYRALIDGDAVIEARLASRFIDGGAQRLQGLLVEGKGDVDGNAVARRLHTLRKTAFSAHSEGTGDRLVYGKPRAQRAALGDPHLLVGPGFL